MLAYSVGLFDEASLLAERAIQLGPNSALALSQAGSALFHCNRAAKAVSVLEHAVRLDPIDPASHHTLSMMAYALLSQENDVRALAIAQQAVSRKPNYAFGWRGLIAAQALSGRVGEARDSLATMLRVEPQFSITALRARTPSADTMFRRVIEGLRMAGAPE